MSLNNENNRDDLLTTKKTRPTQASDEIYNEENDKQELEQDNQSFYKRITEKMISQNIRLDHFGKPITKKGKQRVTFIDKIKPVNFTDVIEIESFKDFNKIEEMPISKTSFNSCCSLL